MKHSKLAMLGGSCGLLLAHHLADAAYVGLQTTLQTQFIAGVPHNVFRVYAVCTDPNDFIQFVGGSPTLGNMIILSRNLTDTGPGSNFVNVLGGGPTAPSAYAISV